MARESHGRKAEEQVREAVAIILAEHVSDPRISGVTVTGVKTSPDRSVASVYVVTDPARYADALAGLESAHGRIRSLLGRALGWRTTPEVRFFIDEAIDEGDRIEIALHNVPPSMRRGSEDVAGTGAHAPADGQE